MLDSRFFRNSAFVKQMFSEGTVEGETQGALKATRASILEVLHARFGDRAAAPFATTLAKIDSLAVLHALIRSASLCSRLDEFQTALAST